MKSLEVLTGEGGRTEKDIIIVDIEMHSFTNRLTNGLLVPTYKINDQQSDNILLVLLKYLSTFVDLEDVRLKIKLDFNLLEKFNGFKQTLAFLKIKKTLEEAMELSITKN